MPRLIVINGPPGCGKSTLARRYADEHSLALNLDIDRLRSSIGRWRDDPRTAGLLARAIALAAARVHLAAGHDVVIPQFLGRAEFLEQLEDLARDADAAFCEIILLDSCLPGHSERPGLRPSPLGFQPAANRSGSRSAAREARSAA